MFLSKSVFWKGLLGHTCLLTPLPPPTKKQTKTKMIKMWTLEKKIFLISIDAAHNLSSFKPNKWLNQDWYVWDTCSEPVVTEGKDTSVCGKNAVPAVFFTWSAINSLRFISQYMSLINIFASCTCNTNTDFGFDF